MGADAGASHQDGLEAEMEDYTFDERVPAPRPYVPMPANGTFSVPHQPDPQDDTKSKQLHDADVTLKMAAMKSTFLEEIDRTRRELAEQRKAERDADRRAYESELEAIKRANQDLVEQAIERAKEATRDTEQLSEHVSVLKVQLAEAPCVKEPRVCGTRR